MAKAQKPPRPFKPKSKGGVSPVYLIGAGVVAALAWAAYAALVQQPAPPRASANGGRPQQRPPAKGKEPTPHELRQQGRQVPGSDRPACRDQWGSCGSVSEEDCSKADVKARCCLSCFRKACVDRDPNCVAWAQKGQCYLNDAYMNATCCFACSPDPEDRCSPDPSQRPDVAEGDLLC